MLVLFIRVLDDFNSQSDFTNLTEHGYLKTHFIKIVPTDCFRLCVRVLSPDEPHRRNSLLELF